MILVPEASTIQLSLLLNICANSLMAYSQDMSGHVFCIASSMSTALYRAGRGEKERRSRVEGVMPGQALDAFRSSATFHENLSNCIL